MSGRLLLFHKPFRVLTQFSPSEGHVTLDEYIDVPDVYPAGRLDHDSEGLLLLTDAGWLQGHISHPRHKLPKTYWAQVEGIPTDEALTALARGVDLKDGRTLPADVRLLETPPPVGPRNPPIRERKSVPDRWIELTIREGKNRQVRRMTAAVGYPTLRLVRWRVGPWTLEGLEPGQWKAVPCPRDQLALKRMLQGT